MKSLKLVREKRLHKKIEIGKRGSFIYLKTACFAILMPKNWIYHNEITCHISIFSYETEESPEEEKPRNRAKTGIVLIENNIVRLKTLS